MFVFYFHLLLVAIAAGSHYRGGTISYAVRNADNRATNGNQLVSVWVTQRHSWRRSSDFCNRTSPGASDTIGAGSLVAHTAESSSSMAMPHIGATVQCTDYSEEFDYSTGENTTAISLPINSRIEYVYQGCCWISLLPPDRSSDWSLTTVVNTKQRPDGRINNSPKTAMNPIVQVDIGKTHVINIPMADSDGDTIRCRWGRTNEECGTVCSPKGVLHPSPCELTYNASELGYHGVALVIEDFDSDNNVISAVPLQFLIHIVNVTRASNCTEPPVYIGEWPRDSCLGVESNTVLHARIQVLVPCDDNGNHLRDILTVSPSGLTKGEIVRDPTNHRLYEMAIAWAPSPGQGGIHQFCATPVDSQQRIGAQACLTFQVDILPPEFVDMKPTGFVSAHQSVWTIETDRDIVPPRRTSDVHVRFIKRSDNEEVHRIDVATDLSVVYQARSITFFTSGVTWEQNEEYYILLGSGIATINESCGVESAAVTDSHAWVFRVAPTETPAIESTTATPAFASTTKIETTTTMRQTTSASSQSEECPQWFPLATISNHRTHANEPNFTFCFNVNASAADITISANTWVPCSAWKRSGTADPLIELYSKPNGQLLAQNDDGFSVASYNCYAAALSYRLKQGDYRVVVRNTKCAYGTFELRISIERGEDRK